MLNLNSKYAKTYLNDIPASSSRESQSQSPAHFSKPSQKVLNSHFHPKPTRCQKEFTYVSESFESSIGSKPSKNFEQITSYSQSTSLPLESRSSLYPSLQKENQRNDPLTIKNSSRKYFDYQTQALPKQFSGRHHQRNEQAKNRVLQEWRDPRGYESKNILPYHEKNTQPSQLLKRTASKEQTNFFQKQVHRERIHSSVRPSAQTSSSRYANFKITTLNEPEKEKYQFEQTPEKNYPCLQNRTKQRILLTPQTNFSGREANSGSAERKKSLIQKSQILQQKLTAIKAVDSLQFSNKNNQQRFPKNSAQFQTSRFNRRQNSNKQIRYKRDDYCGGSRVEKINLGGNQSHYVQARDRDPVRIDRNRKPFIAESSFEHSCSKDGAIDKISRLNDKINQRIQSIITNYSEK